MPYLGVSYQLTRWGFKTSYSLTMLLKSFILCDYLCVLHRDQASQMTNM